MSDRPNTVFLRLEGPLQSWGDPSKFVMRRTMDAPTKSGVIGLICCAMGLSREKARERLGELNALRMGVRIDRPGTRWWDYHTVGAGVGLRTAEGNVKTGAKGTLITRREYLADASFLIAMHGNDELIERVAGALLNPIWPVCLGRKSCAPAVPVLVMQRQADGALKPDTAQFADPLEALANRIWQPRYQPEVPRNEKGDAVKSVRRDCLIDWAAPDGPDGEVWYDVPTSFDPQAHGARLVVRRPVTIAVGETLQRHTPPPEPPRANYSNAKWTKVTRPAQLARDHQVCVFCKSPATTVQHITYRRAGGGETQDDLRSLCRLCHDAVTMIEYGLGMGLDRINPEDPLFRDRIIEKRQEIIAFRSLETRRRRLEPEEVE